MADTFVSLATVVRSNGHVPVESSKPADVTAPPLPVADGPFAHADIVHELVLLRLAALEAFDLSVPRLLERLARDVLGRELLLAPADIDALVRSALIAFGTHEPVAISVAPCDVQRVRAPLPVTGDPQLAAGDLVIQVRDGSCESRFGLRLEDALERARPTTC